MGIQVTADLTVFDEVAGNGTVVQFDALTFEQVAADLLRVVFLDNQFGNGQLDGSGQFLCFLLFFLALLCCCALRSQ